MQHDLFVSDRQKRTGSGQWPAEAGHQTPMVEVCRLVTGASPRLDGLNDLHVQSLMETVDTWPPIVVDGADLTIVDGRHRVEAAKRLGIRAIRFSYFDGPPEEALIESVRLNVVHGLPLTPRDRAAAVHRVLELHREWSDRRIAETCGVSAGLVARMRTAAPQSADSDTQSTTVRVGRDHRARPVDPAGQRTRIAQALLDDPDASLRKIARVVGASPETVRSVKRELAQECSCGPADDHRSTDEAIERFTDLATPCSNAEHALNASSPDPDLTTWLDTTDAKAWHVYVDTVPLSRIYELADEARRRSNEWTRYADTLESRVMTRQRKRASA